MSVPIGWRLGELLLFYHCLVTIITFPLLLLLPYWHLYYVRFNAVLLFRTSVFLITYRI